MKNLHLLYDAYYKGFQQYYDLYLIVTINGMSSLKLQIYIYKYINVKTLFLFFFILSKILDIPAVEAFNRNTDDNLASEQEKWKKRFQYYVAAAGLSDNKQKRAVLLHLTGPAEQEIFNTLSHTGDNYESAIAI